MSNLSKNTRMMRVKQAKLAALVARIALTIAAKENPSAYSKYEGFRKKYIEMKRSIIKRYTPKAIMVAREIVKKSREK